MHQRYKLFSTLLLSFLAINFFTRIILLLVDFSSVDLGLTVLIKMFSVGFFYDLLTAFYYFTPLAIYLLLLPSKIYNSKMHQKFLYFLVAFIIFIMIFNGVSEYFFWEEFGKRFNFIAVDYLVYTHEVLHNIQESYPLPIILSTIFLISLLFTYTLRSYLFSKEDRSTFKERAVVSIFLLLIPIINFNLFDKQGLSHVSNNTYNNELAKNGTYSLFSAFRHNELQYSEFFKTLPHEEVFERLTALEGFNDKKAEIVTSDKEPMKKNVILIMIESMSAEYMGIYGNKKNLTPHLDSLAKESLFFENLFATGTRTVRGMEAITLSFPPTPGRSIVKRPKNDNLDSIGDIFLDYGYDNRFIYAGHGYFDNMNNFFSKNGFKVIDRLDFTDEEVTFSNAWGVCDEDLLTKALQKADLSYADKKPFFSFIMTTSNHRPYTYPEGKIDIPSHTGRDGGVKYTDYAIHKFIEEAKTKPWFKDTVFVIVADHNGGSAGKSTLPLHRYKIPLMIYSPSLIKPEVVSKLSSQIDAFPTLFKLLGFSYEAKFYGNDILDANFTERAFIGNYQKLGYVKDDSLYYLTPDKKAHKAKVKKLTINSVEYEDTPISDAEIKDLVTYYQSASYIYENNIKTKGKNEK